MNRIKMLACWSWLTVIISIAFSTYFWRTDTMRPHAAWGVASLLTIFGPLIMLTILAGWQTIRGPGRLRAMSWLLLGTTPLIWIDVYITQLNMKSHARDPLSFTTPMRVTATWASSILDIEARWRYSRWTHGRHAVLMDTGQTPDEDRLVAEMDQHIESMASLLGQEVPPCEFPWVRGSLFGHEGRAILLWALCGEQENADKLTYVDRHEMAHTLIAALCGPDQYPPFLLIEGWAESQSTDRAVQILSLYKQRQKRSTYSLQELVGPEWYCQGKHPVYTHGGPLVRYLMERYGPEKFFELYSKVQRDTFHSDCQAILGTSWETIEHDFWMWLDFEGQAISKANANQRPEGKSKHKFLNSVDPADWQALVNGYREANSDANTRFKNLSFLIERERVIRESDGVEIHGNYECRAIFQGEHLWMVENYSRYSDRFLMITENQYAALRRSNSGELSGWLKRPQDAFDVREEVDGLLYLHLGVYDPGYLLGLNKTAVNGTTWTIKEIVRPEGIDGTWKVSFTIHTEGDKPSQANYEIELAPSQRWWITRSVRELQDKSTLISHRQYQRLNGLVVPLSETIVYRTPDGVEEIKTEVRVRPLTTTEENELKQRIEQAVQEFPKERSHLLKRFLMTIVIAWPLCGVALRLYSVDSSNE